MLVADVGLRRRGDETRQVVAATGWRKKIPPPSAFVLIMLILVAPGSVAAAQAEEPAGRVWSSRLIPTIRWFSRRGLDEYNNKLDASISSGVPCPQYRRIWPGECPTEHFLTRFLKSLPPDLSVIADTLRSFGAVCRKFGQRLTCTYRKHENYKEMLTNNLSNEEVRYFTAKINIANRNAKLAYSVSFDRKVTTLYRNKPPKREADVPGKFQQNE